MFATLLAALAVGVVLTINHWAGSYAWVVLFRLSFIAGRVPSETPHSLTVHKYFSVFVQNAGVLFSQASLWLLLGVLAWMRRPNQILLVTGLAVGAHFLLFPSPEDRYIVWAYIVVGVAVIRSFDRASPPRETGTI